MKLSTTSQYAIRVLIFMANSQEDKFSTKNLSETLAIPYKYLTQIVTKLVSKNLLKSVLGRSGGISFVKKLNEIQVIDILRAIDDTDSDDCVIGLGKCSEEKKCIVHQNWERARCSIDTEFMNLTLDEFTK